jgi:hypothetical protein
MAHATVREMTADYEKTWKTRSNWPARAWAWEAHGKWKSQDSHS